MANEPENLVLIQLREIRATQAEHSAQFARIDERFGEIDKRLDEMRLLLGHTIGLATTADLRSQEFERRHEFSEGEQRRLSERMDEFERRLTRLEEKTED
jgi:hypothetical protein